MNPVRKASIGLAIILIINMLIGCQAQPTELPTPSPTLETPQVLFDLSISIEPPEAGYAYPSTGHYEAGVELNLRAKPNNGYTFDHWSGDVSGNSSEIPILLDTNKSVTAHFTSISMIPNWDEFEILPTIVTNTDKVAVDQIIANMLSSEPLDPCPVVHKVAEAAANDNPTYMVYISAHPDDFFMVVIHTMDMESENYGAVLLGTIVEGNPTHVIVPAEYQVPEGQDAPDEFEIQVVMPGCEIYAETVSRQNTISSSDASPFIGEWISIDAGDGSTRRLSINEIDGKITVDFSDDAQTSCGHDNDGAAIASTGTGEGTVFFNLLQVELPLFCMTSPQSFLTRVQVNIVYVEGYDTLDDGMVIWNRSDKVKTFPLVFRDEFDKVIDPDWNWIRVNENQWSVTKKPGSLQINLVPTSNAFSEGPVTFLLQDIEEENFEIITRMFFKPQRNFQSAGLAIYEDDENVVSLVRAYADVVDYPGNAIYFDNIYPSAPSYGETGYTNYPTPINSPSGVYLKLRREGIAYTGFYSLDGQSWTLIGVQTSPIEPTSFGLVVGRSEQPITAEFDFFELYIIP